MAKKTSFSHNKKDTKKTSVAEKPATPWVWKILGFSLLLVLGLLMVLGIFHAGGVVGDFLFQKIALGLLGYLGVLLPFGLLYASIIILAPRKFMPPFWDTLLGIGVLLLLTGILELFAPSLMIGGAVGNGIGAIAIKLFSRAGGIVVVLLLILAGMLFLFRSSFNIIEWFESLFHHDHSDEYGYNISENQEPLPQTHEHTPVAQPFEASLKQAEAAAAPSVQKPVETKPEEFMVAPINFSEDYVLPPLSLLSKSMGKPSVGDIRTRGSVIKQTLANFGIDVEMDEVSIGPTVTRYAMKPAQGVKLTRITNLKQDLSLALAAHPLRIEAPIPGKSLVGIEIPNITKSSIGLGTLLEDDEFQNSSTRLLVALGKGVTGKSYFENIAKMPHLLIAGTTGSGKSVTVHNIIISLLYRNAPDELRFIMVDPKRVELTLYNDIPHLLTPVIKEPKKAVLALKWAAKEMERRYDLLEQNRVRDIQSYHENIVYPAYKNKKKGVDQEGLPEKMPYIVVIIDELADIMQAYPRELESAIVRLAQMSRATGIHLILSTQRPSVNVITGLIKANIPSRLALQVASQIDSRTILDTPGAETLLGKGDMLFLGTHMSKPERMQAANVTEEETKRVVEFIKRKNPSLADHIIMSETLDDEKTIVGIDFNGNSDEDDPMYEDAKRAVMEAGKASTSYIQRKLKVGYSRAARLIDILEERGVVGPADGAKPREVLSASPTIQPPLSTDSFGEESF
jgi:S-DNA-T family DNA segregation ATPase FtsK/SpoIIIE